MNIAVFIKRTTLHKGHGGLETQNDTLCEGLVKRGHKVVVFSPKYELKQDAITKNGVSYKFIECSFRSLAGFDYMDKNNWVNRSVEVFSSLHNEVPFNLILAQSSAGLGIIREKNKFDIPVISISHGSTLGELTTVIQGLDSPREWLTLLPKLAYFALNFFRRQREFVLHSDKVVAVSKYVKKAILEETFIDPEKIEVIYNGIEPIKTDPKKGETNVVRLIYVGRVHLSKGLGDLIEVLPDLKEYDIKLYIVGDGPHKSKLESMVSKKKLDGVVSFVGQVSHARAIEMMSNSDIFVLPSKRVEGFPMTIVEAMFAGLPVIGASIGGIPEAIDDGVSGVTYESGSKNQLYERLTLLIKSKKLRENMGQKAKKRARQLFTVDVMLNKYEKIMDEVLR